MMMMMMMMFDIYSIYHQVSFGMMSFYNGEPRMNRNSCVALVKKLLPRRHSPFVIPQAPSHNLTPTKQIFLHSRDRITPAVGKNSAILFIHS